MQRCDNFSSLHPAVLFLYFSLVFLFSMCFMHPLCLAVSLISALACNLCLVRIRKTAFFVRFILPVTLMAVLINPAFNHKGMTILTYLPSGNPLTLESIAYGIAAAVMLSEVIIWFSCYNEVMTSDKFIYLFGRVIPSLSLVLSMTLRFVPKFTVQLKRVLRAQRGIRRSSDITGIVPGIRNLAAVLSVMITWSLENAIETADSMRCRGYGLKRRTAFSIYRFDVRDRNVLIWLILTGGYVIFGWCMGGLHYRYFPAMQTALPTSFSISIILVYSALCLTPLIMVFEEGYIWKHLQSGT